MSLRLEDLNRKYLSARTRWTITMAQHEDFLRMEFDSNEDDDEYIPPNNDSDDDSDSYGEESLDFSGRRKSTRKKALYDFELCPGLEAILQLIVNVYPKTKNLPFDIATSDNNPNSWNHLFGKKLSAWIEALLHKL
jgi:hypothetical protein